MDKIGIVLFGRTTSKAIFRWGSLKESLRSIETLDAEISLLIFQDEPLRVESKEEVLERVDSYKFVEGANTFQQEICEQIEVFKNRGYQKILILSACHALDVLTNRPTMKDLLIWDKRLVLNSLDNFKSKTLNHRFMFGDALLIDNIWRRKKFLPQKDVDANIYLNVKNVIGETKIPEYTHDDLNIIRIGWGTL